MCGHWGPEARPGAPWVFEFNKNSHVRNTLVHVYSLCVGGIECSRKLFDEMPSQDTVSWSAMIGGYVRAGLSADAVALFRKMQVSGVKPDEVTMVLVLSACADLDMDDKTIVSRTSVIGGMPMHGYGSESVALYEKMINAGVVPGDVAFIGLILACSHSGLDREGRKYFTLMKEKFGIEPKILH
ncbi:hypothetical protein CRG98_031178 [Punica granatum]|uniref:Pentatricopeptide repeat-containing protein n=1 Tax=Punica granatum TaxID=22663 RepID=A0A2I0IYB7_PUNGR|nr:hypothetical protein CRG98_031178 [Punica granatum]